MDICRIFFLIAFFGGFSESSFVDAETDDLIVNLQVNAHDEDEEHDVPQRRVQIPNSPPPSFHSRASSPNRNGRVNNDLADAFDDDDASDDEADDRQRLVRQNSTPTIRSTSDSSRSSAPAASASIPATADTTSSSSRPRVMGGGNASDGVFANMSARPERGDANAEKEEQPPVCLPCRAPGIRNDCLEFILIMVTFTDL